MRYRHRKVVAVPQAFAVGVCESLGECDVPGISWGWFRLEADECLLPPALSLSLCFVRLRVKKDAG